MKVGVTTFITDEGIRPAPLARALEERGFDSLFLHEHSNQKPELDNAGLKVHRLQKMPAKPTLADFFNLRFRGDGTSAYRPDRRVAELNRAVLAISVRLRSLRSNAIHAVLAARCLRWQRAWNGRLQQF